MSKRYMTRVEFNAILAGLRCLQEVYEQTKGDLPEGLQSILDYGLEDGAASVLIHNNQTLLDAIDTLCEDINADEVQLKVVDGSPR